MTRQTLREPATLNDAEKAEYRDFTNTREAKPDGSLGGPFDVWLLNPELSHRLRGLGGMLWERTSLDRGLVELAICIAGRVWEANYEWYAHEPRAVQYGIPQTVMDDVKALKRPSGTPEQVLVYDVCISMFQSNRLPRRLYDSAVATIGERGLAEVMAIIGFYTIVSFTLNAFEVQVPEGVQAPFLRED
jgi:4-carboxymuconolactone decarboxylase